MQWSVFGKPLSSLRLLSGYGMRPRVVEAESGGGFLGGKFRGSLDNCAEWIAHLAGILTVRVVDPPQLVSRFQSRGRAHAHSSAQPGLGMVYRIHKMRAQSV
jgi:hypothetical protein